MSKELGFLVPNAQQAIPIPLPGGQCVDLKVEEGAEVNIRGVGRFTVTRVRHVIMYGPTVTVVYEPVKQTKFRPVMHLVME